MAEDRYINIDRLLRAMTDGDMLDKSELNEWAELYNVTSPPTITAEWKYNPDAHDYNLAVMYAQTVIR